MIYKYLLDKNNFVRFKGEYYTQTSHSHILEDAKVYIFDDSKTVYLNGATERNPVRQMDLDATIAQNPYYQAYDFWKYVGTKPNKTLSTDLRSITYANNIKVDYSSDLLYFQSGWAQDMTITIPSVSTDPFTGMYFDGENNYIQYFRNADDGNKLYINIRHDDLDGGADHKIKLSDVDLAGKVVRFLMNYSIAKDEYLSASENQEIKVAWKAEDGTFGIMESFNTPYPTPELSVESFGNSIVLHEHDFLDVPFGPQVFSPFIINALTIQKTSDIDYKLLQQWSDLSDPLEPFESFIVTGLTGGLYNLNPAKYYHFAVPLTIAGEAKGSTLDIPEIERYAYINEVEQDTSSLSIQWKSITSDYIANKGDYLLCDARSNDIVITLPDTGYVYIADGYANLTTNNLIILPSNPAHTIQEQEGMIANVAGDYFYLVLSGTDWRYIGINNVGVSSISVSSNTRGEAFPNNAEVFHQHELIGNPNIEDGLYIFTNHNWSLIQSVN